MRPIDALIATLIGLTILAVVVSQHSATAATIQGAFAGMTALVIKIMAPLQGG